MNSLALPLAALLLKPTSAVSQDNTATFNHPQKTKIKQQI
jgi:hypothetical protein